MPEASPLANIPEEKRETLPGSVAGLAYVLVIGLFVMTFLFQNFAIPSGSMEKTLLVGDHLVVDRTTLAPRTTWFPLIHQGQVQRGDVIVFLKPAGRDPKPDMILVKRAIGLPGDRIHLERGILFRNGQRIDEPQISLPSEQNPYGLQPVAAEGRRSSPAFGPRISESEFIETAHLRHPRPGRLSGPKLIAFPA